MSINVNRPWWVPATALSWKAVEDMTSAELSATNLTLLSSMELSATDLTAPAVPSVIETTPESEF